MAAVPASSSPARHLLPVVGAWTLLALLLATQVWFSRAARGDPIAWWQGLAIWLPWALLWALATPLVSWLLGRFPLARPRLLRDAAVHLLAGAVLAALNLGVYAALAPMVGAVNTGPDWLSTWNRLLASVYLLNLPVHGLLLGALLARRAAQAAGARERHALQLRTELAEARLLALRAQLQPHFLFNALNTISVLMREDVHAADRMLVLLSGLLRRALDSAAEHEVPLRDEIAFVEAYLEIERMRFAERLACRIDVDPSLHDALVPGLILQPLVENAVRHGLAERGVAGRIELEAVARGDRLQLCVRDNGRGLDREAIDGVGLSNTRARLQLLYGAAHDFSLRTLPEGGVEARLVLPLRHRGKT